MPSHQLLRPPFRALRLHDNAGQVTRKVLNPPESSSAYRGPFLARGAAGALPQEQRGLVSGIYYSRISQHRFARSDGIRALMRRWRVMGQVRQPSDQFLVKPARYRFQRATTAFASMYRLCVASPSLHALMSPPLRDAASGQPRMSHSTDKP